MNDLDREVTISDTYSDLSNLSNLSSPQINFTDSRKSSLTVDLSYFYCLGFSIK